MGKFFKSLSLCVIINKMVTIIGTYKAVITHSKSLDITIITNMYLNSFYSPPNRLSSLKRMILSLLFLYPLRPVNGKVSVAGAQGKAGLHVVSERATED